MPRMPGGAGSGGGGRGLALRPPRRRRQCIWAQFLARAVLPPPASADAPGRRGDRPAWTEGALNAFPLWSTASIAADCYSHMAAELHNVIGMAKDSAQIATRICSVHNGSSDRRAAAMPLRTALSGALKTLHWVACRNVELVDAAKLVLHESDAASAESAASSAPSAIDDAVAAARAAAARCTGDAIDRLAVRMDNMADAAAGMRAGSDPDTKRRLRHLQRKLSALSMAIRRYRRRAAAEIRIAAAAERILRHYRRRIDAASAAASPPPPPPPPQARSAAGPAPGRPAVRQPGGGAPPR